MRILVTGAGGFVGRHACRELRAAGHVVCGFGHAAPAGLALDGWCAGDITEPADVSAALRESAPDGILHLAGIAFVPDGASAPERMLRVNTLGTWQLGRAVAAVAPAARLLVVSTAHVYGPLPAGAPSESAPVDETAPAAPVSLYAVSKAAAEAAAQGMARAHGLRVIVARPSNHTGPGQDARFAVPAFAAQVAAIARGTAPAVLKVGNLESVRDFTDVRDVARAYRLLLEAPDAAGIYNIAGATRCTMRAVLDQLCALAGIAPRIERDEALFRPTDHAPCLSTARLTAATGWRAAIPLAQTLRDLLPPA